MKNELVEVKKELSISKNSIGDVGSGCIDDVVYEDESPAPKPTNKR